MRSLGGRLHPNSVAAIERGIRGPHRVLVRVRVAEHATNRWLTVYSDDSGIMNPTDNAIWRIPRFEVVSGSVDESNDDIPRSLDLSLVSDYWQSIEEVLLDISPYRTLLSVERGIQTAGGDFYVPLGVFRVTEVEVTGSGEAGREVSVQGYSMETDVQDSEFITFPRTGAYVAGSAVMGNNLGDIITNLTREAFGMTTPTLITTRRTGITDELDYTFASKVKLSTERDRLTLVKEMAGDSQVWSQFNRLNEWEYTPSPAPTDAPVWTVDAGPEGVLISYGKRFDRDNVYNAVIVTGTQEKTDTTPAWTYTFGAFDTPFGPTQWGGTFGRKPKFHHSTLLKTETQVQNTANRMLAKAKALKAGLDFEFVPNPLIEAGDVVQVVFGDGTTENHLIDTLSIGLGADESMSAETSAKSDEEES